MSLIELKSVNYTYEGEKRQVLNNLNLKIEKGKFYGICGVNGSGKSTLCLLLRSFIPYIYKGQLSGNVSIFNKDIKDIDMNELSTEIGYVFQNPFTQMSMTKDTVYEEIAFGLENLGIERSEMIKRVDNIIEYFGLESIAYKNPQRLSGGQKQKVAISSVVVMNPQILILDEPTSQLDPNATLEIFELLKKLNAQGTTIIVVEHKLELLTEYINEMIILNNGTVMIQGTPSVCYQSNYFLEANLVYPKHYLVGQKLRELNIIDKPFISYFDAKKCLSRKVDYDRSKKR